MTPKIIANMKTSFEEADELDGFEDLEGDDQDRIRKAWEAGKVADEDVPDSARKPEGEEDEEEEDEEKPKAKKGGRKKKVDEEDSEPKQTVFKLEYASSGRAKCKSECMSNIEDVRKADFFFLACTGIAVWELYVNCLLIPPQKALGRVSSGSVKR